MCCRRGHRQAFEITYNGKLLHSKLSTGQFPDPQKVAQNLKAILEAEEAKAAAGGQDPATPVD